MNDTSPESEAFLAAQYAAMNGSERLMMALQMFETAQQIVLSSLDPGLDENAKRREICRRFYGDELARIWFPTPMENSDDKNSRPRSPHFGFGTATVP